MYVLYLFTLLSNVLFCSCQSSMVVNVVEITSTSSYTFVCNISTTTAVTRWTYLTGSTGASLMSYQNGRCTVSPSDSFLSNSTMYSYTCNSTVYQVTILQSTSNTYLNNDILACRDALQPDGTGSNWMIKIEPDGELCNCDQTIKFYIREITEGDNVTLICNLSFNVPYVNWNKNIGSNTAAMGVQNELCATSPGISFLDNTSKYTYTCSMAVYQVTILNVQRSEHNDMYMCTPSGQTEGTGLNWIIHIKAKVTSVTTSPSNYLIIVNENTPVHFTCTTSTARPAASVYWYRHPNGNDSNETRITENTTITTDYNDFSVTTSILRFVPTREDNDTQIYCRANNSVNTSPVRSNTKTLLNVLYKAEVPYILQDNEYRVIENTPGTLSCSAKGGNPTPTLYWRCNNFSPTNQPTIYSNGNVTTTLTWTPSRFHDGTCTCTLLQTGFQDITTNVSLVVLYPPLKPLLRVNWGRAGGDIYFIKGTTRSIECIADSKPSPDRYTWTPSSIMTVIVNNQTLTFTNVTKEDSGEYKCSAFNTMNTSNGGPVAGINSSTVNVIVLYPPTALYFVYENKSGHNISNKEIDVIQGDTIYIKCKSMDSNPSPAVRWYGPDFGSVLTVENIQETRTNATCLAVITMKETNRPIVQVYIYETIRFNILVRPTIKGCDVYYTNRQYTVFNLRNYNADTLMVMENESFTLNCSAEGKPTPIVWWKTPQRSFVSSSSVIINNLTRQMKGDYVFTANSLLEPSFEDKQNVTVSTIVSVLVLYPPAVQPMNAISKLIGERLNMMCNYTAGMPKTTSIKWTRDIDNREWKTATLNIESLIKSDIGIYTCTASNIMIQSGDSTSYIGQHNQSFHLHVQYAATITSFTIGGHTSQRVTLNESDPVRFICNADSNPTAVMTLSDESKTFKTVTSNNVEYKIAEASCIDAGGYYCSAQNVYNGENDIHKTVQLFVNCYPRAANVIDVNITSEKNSTVTMVFNVIAYPPPTYTWYQLVDGNWTPVHEGVKYIITSANIQSNLTIHSVGMDDFTRYKVFVENEFGQMEQIYTLSPYAIPPQPTTPGAYIGGITGGVAGCIIIVVVIIFILRKYSLFKVCSKSSSRGKGDETNHSAQEHAYYNVGSDTIESQTLADETAYYNVSSVPEYETINQNNVESSPYSTLDQTELCTISDDTNEEKTAVYENLKPEVF